MHRMCRTFKHEFLKTLKTYSILNGKKCETFSQHISAKKLYRRLMFLNFVSEFLTFYIRIKKLLR